jgi:thiamine pyrophosphokinase
MPVRCVIISGGECSDIIGVTENDFVIACDRGYEYAKNANIVPDLVVGDFDSYSGGIEPGVVTVKHPREKDDTDTMIAVRHAVEHGYKELIMFCALGGRLDHTYANLQAAAYAARNRLLTTVFDNSTIIYVLCNGTLQLPRRDGYSVSLFSHSDRCEQVTTQGLKYPLKEAVLTNDLPMGVSNEWDGERAAVSVGDGTLLIILSKHDG